MASCRKVCFPCVRRTYRTFRPPPVHVEGPQFHRKISGPKSLGLCSFFLPDFRGNFVLQRCHPELWMYVEERRQPSEEVWRPALVRQGPYPEWNPDTLDELLLPTLISQPYTVKQRQLAISSFILRNGSWSCKSPCPFGGGAKHHFR